MNEAEQGVVGSVLIDSSCLYDVYENLKPEMFASDFLGDCYREMLAMYDTGVKINIIELQQRIENRKWDPEYIGEELNKCLLSSPTSVMVKSYAGTIVRNYRANETTKLLQRVSLAPKDIDGTIAELMARLEELQQNESVKSKALKQVAEECKGKYFNDQVGEGLIKTGFYNLDNCLGGLEGGDVTVIGARPAVGKSAFVTQMIGNMAKNGYRVGYYNLEMNESQVYERFIARLSGLSLTRIRRAKAFLGGEEEKFNAANEELTKYDVIISTGSKTVGEIRAESRHQNFDIIIIDYLQLIKADKHYANRASEVGDISKAIKELSMELHVPIVLLSQLNRKSELNDTKEPTMSELRESGDIEQDASNILLLWNVSEKSRSYKALKVEKQRQGEDMKEGLKFDGDKMTFQERREDFKKYMAHVNSLGKDHGFEETDEAPFGSNWG